MKSDLDNFTDNMDNLDAWLDDTSHELSDIRRSAATSDDTEALLEAFKVRRHLYGYLGDTGDPFTWGGAVISIGKKHVCSIIQER